MRVRLSDVAAAAGVHLATASRALNEHTRHRVSDATVEKVQRAAKELNYFPDTMARGLARGKSSEIGVIIGDITVPLYPPILRGIDDVLSAAGYTALIVNTDNDPDREKGRLQALASRSIEGLIVATATVGDGQSAEFYTSIAPSVFVIRSPEEEQLTSVVSNDAAGVRDIVHHLASLGHTKIAHLAGPQNISTAVTRLNSYKAALQDHNLTYDSKIVKEIPSLRYEDAVLGLEELLDSGNEFTAVIAFNDLLAYGTYRALRDHGLDCPGDVSIAGFNNITGSDLVAPPLTTVAVNHSELGRRAATEILSKLRNGTDYEDRPVQLPVRTIIRDSTGPVRPPHQ